MLQSPLAKAVFRTRTVNKATPIVDGDTIWQIDGRKVGSPEELAAALASGTALAKVRIYRVEWMPELEVPRELLPGTNASQQLGISDWSRGRDWRATGFFSHWVTYSEVLQLIASLALGIFLALKQKKVLTGLLLVLAVLGLCLRTGNDSHACFVDRVCAFSGGDVVADFIAPHAFDRKRLRDSNCPGQRRLPATET